jgi:hypothetical protein
MNKIIAEIKALFTRFARQGGSVIEVETAFHKLADSVKIIAEKIGIDLDAELEKLSGKAVPADVKVPDAPAETEQAAGNTSEQP